MSGPPAFRGARLEEMPGGSVAQIRNHFGDESPKLSHPNKENSPVERGDANDGRHLAGNGSVDSGVDTDVSLNLAVREKIHTHPKEGHWEFLGGGGLRSLNLRSKA